MKMKTTFKIYTLALLTFALASFLLLHFTLIWVYGKFYIYESNVLVLVSETTLIVAIICFSVLCLAEQLRAKR